ncbi:2-isopropylmalate synthase [Sporobacter termitidis DSM 10068]|uniref:2-isopropylmalate synthase n=1 Tax=Sporobacter termitidis DSM 10068 TaxID=1123282 RepID=A0A1M5ZGV2_9FIRM|nr:2-isopropylmalate synthase [Sporobacter termitidis]SHI23419.1 2-isopropylmalate synthase [Sporobacter termitidis DSM 10068]
MEHTIRFFDTTLRDGEQSPGCSMDLSEKLEVARQLERLKVDVIEAGFAISSPGDFESVSRIAREIKDCTVASLARTNEKDIDAAYDAVKHAASPLIHTFISTSPVHMQYVMKMTPEQVLEKTAAMVKYAAKKCPAVEFSAQDATRSDWDFLVKVFNAAISNGATVINVPDTVGYTTQEEMAQLIRYLRAHVNDIDKAAISVHCHNDLGMAVANSLAAVGAGATQVECTINGIGERAGNAALEELAMALRTRKDYFKVSSRIDTTQIYRASKLIYSIIGVQAPLNKAVVGASAFAHESGIHQHGVLSERTTYEIMSPESIGLPKNKLVLGKHSGRHAFVDRITSLGYTLTEAEINKYFEEFKKLADKKKTVSDDDIEALITSELAARESFYKLSRFDVFTSNASRGTCVMSLEAGGEILEDVALGDGPIDAAYNAIDKLVDVPAHTLEDYAIRSVSDGKDALGEVIVKLRTGNAVVTGRGLSTNIIESSILAYLNGVNKVLERRDKTCETGDVRHNTP